MLMSSPVASRTSIAVGRTDIRTRPREPSLMSTISTPRSRRGLAPCTSFSTLWPRGGSSSTVTRNSRASSRRWSSVGGALVARPVGSGGSARARRAGSTRAAAAHARVETCDAFRDRAARQVFGHGHTLRRTERLALNPHVALSQGFDHRVRGQLRHGLAHGNVLFGRVHVAHGAEGLEHRLAVDGLAAHGHRHQCGGNAEKQAR
jgi:hypothetical protein